MAENISIRPAAPHDACAVTQVFSAARDSLGFLPPLHTHDETMAFIAGVIAEQTVLLAEGERGAVAMAAFAGGWLNHLYVDPAHHRRGIGTALLAAVKDQCPDGFALWCFQANAAARRFYERHGCIAVECTDGSGNEERLPDMRYAWKPVSTILSARPPSTAR